uniref:Cilia- and flagella-associated protein 36 n=1 Tax=Heterosigma akashiwo TaxID=2829 RepID=A0A6V1QFZ2_HETAK|mmetsp:Transcript_50897/g.74468  ORF Transcript_50897/g.74468 Transcript_50897/m.74468 type:complete len:157 (-) Transcript_50897:218-688(-)
MESKHEGKEEFAEEEETKGSSKEVPNAAKSIVEKVQEFFYEDDEFAAVFEKFVEENAHTIDLDSDENKLEYTDLYNEYQKLFESQLEGFIESQGSSVLEFYSEVRKANEEDPDSATAVLGRIMASTCDFDVFLYMMKEEKERQVRDDPEFQAKLRK